MIRRHSAPRGLWAFRRRIAAGWMTALLMMAAQLPRASAQSPARGWFRGGSASAEQIQSSPLIVDIDADGRQEIFVTSGDNKLYGYKHDGTPFGSSGQWPVTLSATSPIDGVIASAAAGDIDSDGAPEIIVMGDDRVGTHIEAQLRVYTPSGSLKAQMSFSSGTTDVTGKAAVALINCFRYLGSTPHPGLEIVFRDGLGRLHVLRWNAATSALVDLYDSGNSAYNTIPESSPIPMQDRFGSQPITSSASVRELSATQCQIVVGSTNDTVYSWTATSTSAANWSISSPVSLDLNAGNMVRFYASPVLADLGGSSSAPEVIAAATDGRVYVWNESLDGTQLDPSGPGSWPQPNPPAEAFISSPAIADLDGDGSPEIIAGSTDGKIYAWHATGIAVEGWPKPTGGDVFGSIVAGELDGTAGLEVVASSFDGRLYAWSDSGAPAGPWPLLPGWPKRLGTPLYASPALGDLHGSGRLSVVTGGFNGKVFVFDLAERSLDPEAGWLQFRGGPLRAGVLVE